uniref:Si:dkey-245n4.2 n=1 Tax=Labrus bergylta TaxID=56723 RepID=A0A3Q3LKK3_9LABR
MLGKCLQVQEGSFGGRVSLGDCSPYSAVQEWRWLPESQALRSHRTGECLTAPAEQYEGVHLQSCIVHAERQETGDEVPVVEMDREARSQSWSCSKKGHITLTGRGLHLSATQESTLVFLSREHKQMGWKITMLVLSSLALVLGAVILILNVYSNRRKKVVCVLKSYTPRPEMSVPRSPVPNERAPLTEHAMCLPHSTPTLQRGEILIQWKDGTVTPL